LGSGYSSFLEFVDKVIYPGSGGKTYRPELAEPDIDIREWIKLKDVMEEYQLGPNGAQVACADLIALNIDDIKKSIDTFKTDFVFLDTPGQLELFVFRESGNMILKTLNPNRSIIGYLIDHILARNPTGFITQLLLSLTTQYRSKIPQINMLSKADMFSEPELEEILLWAYTPELLENAVSNQKATIYREMSEGILRLIKGFLSNSTLFPVSKEEFLGIEDLYTNMQIIFQGGEDVDPD